MFMARFFSRVISEQQSAARHEGSTKKPRFSEEPMVKILREADKAPVAEVAKKYGISEVTIYAWRNRFGALKAVDVKRLRQLKLEDGGLTKPVGERASNPARHRLPNRSFCLLRIPPKKRRSSGPGLICTLSTGITATPSSVVLASSGGCARRNFSTIIVLPLLVGPTKSKFGIRVRLGKVSKSSIATSAASARA
jgi:transposase-like protein